MSRKTEVKVCGLTNLVDAGLAAELGAGFLGFIFYPKSPRATNLAAFRDFQSHLPPVKKVYVQVRPEPDALRAVVDEGFDFFQLHFSADEDPGLIEEWAEIVSPAKLWLAPKIVPGGNFPHHLQHWAETFLIDTYRKESFGGTGETGNWRQFRSWARATPDKRWILAGGLNPGNIAEAIQASGADVVDVASGIEKRPGEKDHKRMRAFFTAVTQAEYPLADR